MYPVFVRSTLSLFYMKFLAELWQDIRGSDQSQNTRNNSGTKVCGKPGLKKLCSRPMYHSYTTHNKLWQHPNSQGINTSIHKDHTRSDRKRMLVTRSINGMTDSEWIRHGNQLYSPTFTHTHNGNSRNTENTALLLRKQCLTRSMTKQAIRDEVSCSQ